MNTMPVRIQNTLHATYYRYAFLILLYPANSRLVNVFSALEKNMYALLGIVVHICQFKVVDSSVQIFILILVY